MLRFYKFILYVIILLMENWPAAETDLGYFTTDHLDNVQILVCSAVIQGTVFNAQECIVVSGSIIVCQCAFFLYAVHFYWESICNMILEVILYLLFFSFSTNQILTLLSLGSVLILWLYPGSLRSVKWPFILQLELTPHFLRYLSVLFLVHKNI